MFFLFCCFICESSASASARVSEYQSSKYQSIRETVKTPLCWFWTNWTPGPSAISLSAPVWGFGDQVNILSHSVTVCGEETQPEGQMARVCVCIIDTDLLEVCRCSFSSIVHHKHAEERCILLSPHIIINTHSHLEGNLPHCCTTNSKKEEEEEEEGDF